MKTLDLGITFDDKAVEEWFEKEGMKQAVDRASAEIVKKVERQLINKGYRTPGGLPVHADWYAWLKDMAAEAVTEYKDDVICPFRRGTRPQDEAEPEIPRHSKDSHGREESRCQ